MQSVRLVGTSLSHFARKPRILLNLYSVPYEFVDIGIAPLAKSPQEAGDNPLMKVPVLQANGIWMIESDHISGYIVDQVDPIDRYQVHSRKVFDLNTRAMLNGIMNETVKVIGAMRHDVPMEKYYYFTKCRESIKHGLSWLEEHHAHFDSENPKYKEFHFLCMYEFVSYFESQFVPLQKYPHLIDLAKRINEVNSILRVTAPHVLKPKQ